MSNYHEVDVVIIGAGLAGLTAALQLNKTNLTFIVVEARTRPGGRIYSHRTSENVTIDLGAQWFSRKHHRVQKLISQFGLHTVSTFRKGKSIYELNGTMNYQKSAPVSSMALIDIFQFSRKLNKISRELDERTPWHGPAADYDKITMEQLLESKMHTKLGKKYLTQLLEELLCANLYEVSALDVLWCLKTAGGVTNVRNSEQMWVREGMGALTDAISNFLKEKIRYDRQVEKIYDENHCSFIYTSNDCWKAKKVIIAIPPNLQTRIHFQPPLPASKAQLNERSGLPSVIKMIFVYKTPFWREFGLNGNALLEDGPLVQTFDSSPEKASRGVLTVLINGTRARNIERLSIEARKREVLVALVRCFGEEAEEPLYIYENNWSEELWTRGGYGVHYAPGIITNFGSALFEPISSIHWAGSETATEWRLYMEGAVQSGERAAKEVIDCLAN
ncbi:hypothetical protein BKP35_01020 [Anaerobacillus arseniciselenatis]|uniref:Amine oxidase domain-containing protein n=1 Tax=Anaerobacillus arseniciselenatis TaxID=85682 RepID=A0A1S2LTE9_9BACI|nr:FAD-dependent oxidoreductase [Anaerobacillus arseniciselenatis]OIJ15604.1 hypothetical protein BKP35_01020 [Anaerobacillus arseniciselenatis]